MRKLKVGLFLLVSLLLLGACSDDPTRAIENPESRAIRMDC